MQSQVIVGSTQKSRQEYAKKLASEKSSKFDTVIADTAEVHGIEAVRELIAQTSRKPFDSALTSILILEAQNLTIEAQNALLKSLEEPPEFSQIILTAPTKDLLLPTVASRLAEISLNHETETTSVVFTPTELKNQKLSEQLQLLEKLKREDYLQIWAETLKNAVLNQSKDLKTIHRYNKLLLKMVRAEKSLVNKKLIDLILALEIPQ